MKKLLLFFVLAGFVFFANSCSSDSSSQNDYNSATGTVSFKANGVQKTYHSIKFHEQTYLSGTPDEYVGVDIFTDDGIDGYEVMFSFIEGDLTQLYNFVLINGGDVGLTPSDGFTINVTSNTNKHLTGTFFGPIDDIDITEGTFNIQY